ncbi:MAG: glycosyltransferase [Caldilineaceae bacterium]|nr:glycosyltransferase [Caldilineaceae bacterium]HRJ41947.1 glycosyltransferase [Caldilineaceae bacterium]
MRIAFVVQRYGPEINGGAEMEARLLAEHLSPYMQIDVLTTCAVDYMTWENCLAPGLEQVNSVPVRRFPVRTPRNVAAFNRFSSEILARSRSFYDEMQWMELQGPDTPELFDYIQQHQDEYDLFLFFTYLYATTYVGLQLAPHKSLLFPTAHDERWIHFDIFRPLFHLPRGFIFNSHEEEEFTRAKFRNDYIPGIVLGVGIDIPSVPLVETLKDEYILYLGRIDSSKGCDELFRYFLRYKEATRDPVKLVLIGAAVTPVPQHLDIIHLGYMKEERFAWLRDAQLLVLPSAYESLSLVTLEAWALGVPVLLNGRSPVLRGHCQRSNGGLFYDNEEEFIESLRLLRLKPELRLRLGRQGEAYVTQNYQWSRVTKQYVAFMRQMCQQTASGISSVGVNRQRVNRS